jgi:hypothetical protein
MQTTETDLKMPQTPFYKDLTKNQIEAQINKKRDQMLNPHKFNWPTTD